MASTFKTVLVDFKDTERPEEYFLHGKSVLEFNESDELIDIVGDTRTYQNLQPISSLINKAAGSPLYWYYQLIDTKYYLYPPTHAVLPEGEASYYSIPFGSEHIIDHDTQAHTYGSYYPYHWTHLEISNATLAQGLLFNRTPDAGDNLKRAYINGVSWLSAMAAAVGTAETNILGIAYIPCTDRLNT